MHGYETPWELIRSITNIATELYANPEDRKDFLDTIEREGIVKHFQIKVRLRDGSIRYMFLNERAVKDETGKTLYFEGTVDDITEKRLAFEQVVAQRDLAVQLSRIDSLEEGLHLILKTAIAVSGMECGGISLKNKETGGFDLVCSIGCADDFLEKVWHVGPGSFTWSRMVQKRSFHIRPDSSLAPVALQEGFTFVSAMPMLQGDEIVGLPVTASKVLEEIPEQVRIGLEALAAESGNVIARMQTSRALEAEHQNLLEANTALKVLLRHREEDREQLEQALVENVTEIY
jgi:PAS domain S-box-containing protein